MKIENLETPALIVDEAVFNGNMAAMTELLRGKSLALRPHYKSHKCADIAKMQIAAGSVGMTCAKLSEALDLADAGIEDILIANQVVEPKKIERLASLASDVKLTVCVDCKENILALSKAAINAKSTVHCLVEYEIGLQRCGVCTHNEVIELARLVADSEGLAFEGIQAYAGQLSHEADEEKRRTETEKRAEDIKALLREFESQGLKAKTLSGGSTGTSVIKAEQGLYTELQAGSYLFMDATYKNLNIPFKNSLFILTTVVSVREGLAIVDSGVKSCGTDQGMPVPVGFDAKEICACEEHFQIIEPSRKLKVGEKILLMPAHCCSTVNLYDKLYFVSEGKVSRRVAVSARGCSR